MKICERQIIDAKRQERDRSAVKMQKKGWSMKEITLEATVENINRVTDFVDEFLDELSCPVKTKMQIDIAIDELFGNIAYYAYGEQTGEATVRIEWCEPSETVVISFLDHGTPFNPLEKENPDITLSAEERSIGGLGIYMVRKNMDEVSYEFADGQNRLQIKKKIMKS